jgi:tRNA threonylcarbamoyl adenosine modification protein YjeE
VSEPITSPTFTLVHSYDTGGVTLHHADLYRLDQLSEVVDLALGELAEYRGIVLVEWGDVAESTFGDHLVVRLAVVDADPDARLIEINPVGGSWSRRWPRLHGALAAWAKE